MHSLTFNREMLSPLTDGISLVDQLVKNPPAMQETSVRSLDQEDPLEKAMANRSSFLAWRISWRGLAGYSPWCRQVSNLHLLNR